MFDYQNVLNCIYQEILLTEDSKRNISRQILLEKDQSSKEVLIYYFLSCELDKHEMFQTVAYIASSYYENDVLNRLEQFYHLSPGGSLLERIEEEIRLSTGLVEIAKKGTDKNERLDFVERRYLQEVKRYVIAQARFYVTVK
ncbi:MAG: hypothetical protein U9N81_09300 [Bacillota bacterium]|nr:hypothetical protein [Bacillota bacterium]